MRSLAARTIAALRHEHDVLVQVATELTDDQLTGPSGAAEWSVAQVLSHLGSGSEIGLATLRAALGEGDAPDDAFNHAVWDRWNAMAPADQRAGYLTHGGDLVVALERLSPEQHASLGVPLGFMPAPLPVTSYAGMRVNEVAVHGWDVRIAVDPEAGLLGSALVLAEHLAGDLGFMVGFIGHADAVDEPVVLALGDTGFDVVIDDAVRMQPSSNASTARFSGPAEAALRLLGGRLAPAYTPGDVVVTGNVTLDQLRRVFPGF
jgi:uncharacterized protein (TIGR03083 family)